MTSPWGLSSRLAKYSLSILTHEFREFSFLIFGHCHAPRTRLAVVIQLFWVQQIFLVSLLVLKEFLTLQCPSP